MGESLLLYALQSPQTLTGNIALLCPKVTILGKDGTEIVAPSQSWLLGKSPELSSATYLLATPPSEILGKLLFVHLYLKATLNLPSRTSGVLLLHGRKPHKATVCLNMTFLVAQTNGVLKISVCSLKPCHSFVVQHIQL